MESTNSKKSSDIVSHTAKNVMERLADTAIAHERLPMLDIVFDKLTRMLTESFLHLVSTTDVQVKLDSIAYTRFGDFMSSSHAPSIIAVARASTWDNSFIISVDTKLIFILSEVLLGGTPHDIDLAAVKNRTPTNIEMQIARRIFNLIAQRLGDAFDSVTEAEFTIERLEMNPQFAAIARVTSAAVQAEIALTVADVPGPIKVIFPYTTLEPLKKPLQQMFVGEHFGRDAQWERHFKRTIKNTSLDFEAILHQEFATLSQVLNWKEGDTITFDATAETQVRLVRDDMEFFRGPMGRKNGRIAAQLDEFTYLQAADNEDAPSNEGRKK
ncbi:FliM/FliN family flagellar motor switch protein [Hyphococcus sp.]|uniref:FliM/FliN family flagellar motor switch protein n=1 Tax=Hyphococcus sp. TaxID=2038636 RepID=UPI003D12B080